MTDTTATTTRPTGCCNDPLPHGPHVYIAPGVDGIDSTTRQCHGVVPARPALTETQVLDALSRAFRRLVRTSDTAGHRQAGLRVALRAAENMDEFADVVDELVAGGILEHLRAEL